MTTYTVHFHLDGDVLMRDGEPIHFRNLASALSNCFDGGIIITWRGDTPVMALIHRR